MLASAELEAFARAISRLFGWIYFLSWSISFYPQPLTNHRRRTTAGTTPDFPTANVLGYVALTLSNGLFLFNPTVRAQYAARHPLAPEPTVRDNDFAFALHALVVCLVIWSQYLVPRVWGYNKVEAPAERSVSWTMATILTASVGVICVGAGWTALAGSGSWQWLDFVYLLGYIKLLMTFLKYLPQLLLNYRRRSTTGWSIETILLDLGGGILSFAQLLIDSALSNDMRGGVLGNPTKLVLANLSSVYDVLFMVQHYILYKGNVEEKGNEEGGRVDGRARQERTGETTALLTGSH